MFSTKSSTSCRKSWKCWDVFELKKLENKAKTDIQGTIAILNDKENDIVKRQKNFEDITKHASDFQAFFGMREVKSNVTEHEQYIQSISDDQNFTQINITCSIDRYLRKSTPNPLLLHNNPLPYFRHVLLFFLE
jgi:hypothetical protein